MSQTRHFLSLLDLTADELDRLLDPRQLTEGGIQN